MNMELLTHEEFGELRMQEIEGTPWFMAKDICKALDISNHRDATAFLDETERSTFLTDTRSANGVIQKRDMVYVNEPGLYQLIFQSRKPSAKKFTRWVASEVLPAIRKEGSYTVGDGSTRASFPKLESYKGELCISSGWLVRAGVVSKRATITGQIQRGNIVRLRRACKATPALLVYNTLPEKWREKLEKMYGMPQIPDRHAYKYTHVEMLELVRYTLERGVSKADIVNRLLSGDVDAEKV